MQILDFLTKLYNDIVRDVQSSFALKGWQDGVWALSKYALILALVIAIPVLVIVRIRRFFNKRRRRRRAMRNSPLDLGQLRKYEGDLHAEIEHLAAELASHPGNPQPMKFPDGHFEIAREGMGGVAHRLFDQILEESRNLNAGEVHIVRTPTEAAVRYRVSGFLTDRHTFARHLHPILVAVAKGRASMDIGVRNIAEHGFYIGRVPGRERRMNVMVFPGSDGPDLVIRFTNTVWPPSRLVDLGLTDAQVQTYGELLLPARGMLLITGPGHSAKTSLGYTTLFHLQEGRRKIIALEERPLTTLPGVQQRLLELNRQEEKTEVFKQALREHPKILYLEGVLPDETLALVSADFLRRSLFMRVVDTVKVGRLLYRISRFSEDPATLVKNIIGIVDCRLIRKICPACRQTTTPSRAAARIFQEEISFRGIEFFRGSGCAECEHTGYKDLTGLFAVVTPNEELLNGIRTQAGVMEMERIWKDIGEKSLRRNGVSLASQGVTTLDELVRVLSPSKEDQLS